MRLIGQITTGRGARESSSSGEWTSGHTTPAPEAAKTAVRLAAETQLRVERLEKANSELRAALARLIIFAAPRTAIVNECGDRIIDPNVLNAKAVLTAVEAGL
jgi:hypothetical protein